MSSSSGWLSGRRHGHTPQTDHLVACLVCWISSSGVAEDHPHVKVYYDPYNMVHYRHSAESIAGIKLLGKDRICQVHVKNGERLLDEPGLVDWRMALQALNEIDYEGWYVFESDHKNRAQVVEATAQNIAFLRKHAQMPSG